ncbi:hypothetical protein GCM10011345_24080 [Gemmobacter megaterium]|nr:hypothetical protein GCM10011345_24080 [Gemmobacter megaterium]
MPRQRGTPATQGTWALAQGRPTRTDRNGATKEPAVPCEKISTPSCTAQSLRLFPASHDAVAAERPDTPKRADTAAKAVESNDIFGGSLARAMAEKTGNRMLW